MLANYTGSGREPFSLGHFIVAIWALCLACQVCHYETIMLFVFKKKFSPDVIKIEDNIV